MYLPCKNLDTVMYRVCEEPWSFVQRGSLEVVAENIAPFIQNRQDDDGKLN